MKVVCIDNRDFSFASDTVNTSITIGKIYNVIDLYTYEYHYLIINDNNQEVLIVMKNFILLKEYRLNRLKEMLNES